MCATKFKAHLIARGQGCPTRHNVSVKVLDELVWQDLCDVIRQPEHITQALQRAQSGQWLSQSVQARQKTLQQTLAQLSRQEERLLEAYLGEVIELAEFEHKRADISQKKKALETQQHQLEAQAHKQIEVAQIATSIHTFCQQIEKGLNQATFDQKRQLVELLIDRVIVTDDQVEIRYVIPIDEEGTKTRFCHLRANYCRHPE